MNNSGIAENLNAKQFIQNLRLERFQINPDGSSDSRSSWYRKALTKAVEQLATGLYEKDSHFIMELIQNAEDNHYLEGVEPELRFVLLDVDPTNTSGSDGCLCVFNNESGFEPNNIESICDVGASTKSKKDGYVGEKGIGFKSVYIVSASPHVFSNDYQFKFYEKDSNFELNYIVPYWVDDVPEVVVQEGATTSLLLPLKSGQKQKIIDHLDDISPESILFLNKLSGLSIEVESDGTQLSFKRVMLDEHRCELQVSDGEAVERREYWLHKEIVGVDPDLKEEKREGITEREICLALPLDSKGVVGNVFSYLPTEANSGFPFLVNADFMLTANRESIQTERPWNIWLRDRLSEVILKALLDIRSSNAVGDLVYGFIPMPSMESTSRFFLEVSEEVCTQLSTSEFVLSDQNEVVRSADLKIASKKIHSLFVANDRPKWFIDKSFVHGKLRKYSAQLKAISVEAFVVDDLLTCLDDEDWLQARPNEWFLELYHYLLNSSGPEIQRLSEKKIFPVQCGAVMMPVQDVYWTETLEASAELDQLVEGSGIPKVNFLNTDLFNLVRSQKKVFEWLSDELDLRRFSFSTYLVKTLLPWLNTNLDKFSNEGLLAVTQLILNRWSELGEGTLKEVGNLLPVLLDHGSELESGELVVPRSFDADFGWQHIFTEPEDSRHLRVMSEAYLRLVADQEKLSAFLECIGATSFPLFEIIVFERIDIDKRSSEKYLRTLLYDPKYRSTREKTLKTILYPTFLADGTLNLKSKSKEVLIKWLDYHLKQKQKAVFEAELVWFFNRSRDAKFESMLIYVLKNTAWINSTKGLKKPNEVFIPSDTLKALFGNSLPYLEDSMPSRLADFFKIKSNATMESLIDLLKTMSGNSDVDGVLVSKIYRYLNDYCNNFSKEFGSHKLIYIPDSLNAWYSSGEVIWEEASEAFGDSFGWLSNVYPNFREFFVEELHVKEEVDNQAVLAAWIRLQTTQESKEKIKAYLSFAIPKVIKMIKDEPESEALDDFFDEAKLWLQNNEWSNPLWNEVYIPDNDKLRRLFSEEIKFPWLRDNYTHPQQSFLYERFKLPKLSESVRYSVGSSDGFKLRERKELLTEYSVRLICELIANSDKSDERTFEAYVNSGLVASLVHANEKLGSELNVEVGLEYVGRKRLPEAAAFLDIAKSVLFINESADEDDVKDDIAESLARAIWPRNFKARTDTVRNILGVSTEKRYKKLRGDKGWSFSHDNRKLLESIMGKPQKNKVDTPSKVDSKSGLSKTQVSGSNQALSPSNPGSTSDPLKSEEIEKKDSGKVTPAIPPRQPAATRDGGAKASTRRATEHRVTRRRSKTVNTHQVNAARRNRVLTYIHSDLTDPVEKTAEGIEKQKARKALGDAAEQVVFEDLIEKGYKAHKMAANNKGYDIEAVNTQTGEVYFVEVKGNYDTWSAKGVGISSSQYSLAAEKQLNYFLAVVDGAQSKSPRIYYLRDPINCITEYRLDHMWAQLATSIDDVDFGVTRESVLDELLELTDDLNCKYLISECDKRGYPLPEVGIELSNDSEEVVFESIELAWEDEHIAVVLDEISLNKLRDLKPDWNVYLSDEAVLEKLDTEFGL